MINVLLESEKIEKDKVSVTSVAQGIGFLHRTERKFHQTLTPSQLAAYLSFSLNAVCTVADFLFLSDDILEGARVQEESLLQFLKLLTVLASTDTVKEVGCPSFLLLSFLQYLNLSRSFASAFLYRF